MANVDPVAGLPLDRSLNHFLEVGDQTTWIRVEIKNDKFVKSQEGKQSGNLEAEFTAVAAILGVGPCYVLLKVRPDRWICLVFLPPSGKPGVPSPQNRLYAASAAALQHSVVGEKGKILYEYVFANKTRCRLDLFLENQRQSGNALLTSTERLLMDTPVYGFEPLQALEPPECKFDDSFAKAIAGFKNATINTVFLSLTPNTLAFTVDYQGAGELEAPVAKLLATGDHPEFILHKIADVRQQGALRDVMLLFVPKKAPPKLKMLYAMSKAVLLRQLLPLTPFSIECWKLRHVNNTAIIDEIYPKIPPPPLPAKKLQRVGKGRPRYSGQRKFSDSVRIHTPPPPPRPK